MCRTAGNGLTITGKVKLGRGVVLEFWNPHHVHDSVTFTRRTAAIRDHRSLTPEDPFSRKGIQTVRQNIVKAGNRAGPLVRDRTHPLPTRSVHVTNESFYGSQHELDAGVASEFQLAS